MSNTIHPIAILFRADGGREFHGAPCRTLECAVTNIVPVEGARVLGYTVFEPEPAPAVDYRSRMLGGPLPSPTLTVADLVTAAAQGFRDGAPRAPAGHAAVKIETLQWWRELATLNPADLVPRIDAMIAAAKAG